jgi:hypothetical protein
MSARALLERIVSPGLGYCYRCRRPWIVPKTKRIGWRTWQQLDGKRFFGLVGVKAHDTEYGDGAACFPLCEGCWSSLTPTQRWPYYAALIERWKRDIDVPREKVMAINDAVSAGR